MNRIALVEDHERLADLVRKALAAAGIEVDHFLRIDAAWRAVKETAYAMIIVDRGLPDGDGLQLVQRLRSADLAMPCLMLTACARCCAGRHSCRAWRPCSATWRCSPTAGAWPAAPNQ